jgi:S-formylglutathione hydrolase FrmB
MTRALFVSLFAFAALAACQTAPAEPPGITVSVDPGLLEEPYTGRVYVLLSEDDETEPRLQGRWVDPPLTFVADVENWRGRAPVALGTDPQAHPVALGEVEPGAYTAQAFIRLNPYSANAGQGAGDLYSAPVTVSVPEDGPLVADFALTEAVAEEPFPETDQIKHVEFRSEMLSEFHGFDYVVDVAVRLPKDWSADADRTWPVLYYVTGFGGTHESIFGFAGQEELVPALDEVIVVLPNAENYWGHSVFADSAVTGPWGSMLVEELAPYVDETYSGGGAEARYVTGASSGGWASLWLQVEYPESFAGAWSHVPDPVDFRAFQTVDIYAEDANIYRYPDGSRRPIGRRDGEVFLWADEFIAGEETFGPGGQIRSFDAVFSPRLPDGTPRRLFDVATGDIDPATAEAWKPYDINLKLRAEWDEIGDELAGKLHVYAGEIDNFYLEGAVELLIGTLDELGSDAEIMVVPGLGHAFAPGVPAAMLEEITGVDVAD